MPADPRLTDSEPARHLSHGHPAADHNRKDGSRQRRHLRQRSSYLRSCLAASRTDRLDHLAWSTSFEKSFDPSGTALIAS
jgi:hypothetical protein